MDAAQQNNVGIGITYAVRHLRTIFLASKLMYPGTWRTDAAGDEHERRRADIEMRLKANNSYLIIGAGTVIAGEALGYIYRTDNLMDKLVNPAKDGTSGDWKPTRSVTTTLLDDMESDLSRIRPRLDQIVQATNDTVWTWDASREEYYYYDTRDRIRKYHNGMWLRLDGSQTSQEQEMQLAQAYNLSAQPSWGHQASVASVTASFRQITMGRGEDASLS